MEQVLVLVNAAFDLVERASSPGNVTIIVGGRGTGKTATGFDVLEKVHAKFSEKPTFVVGIPPESRKLMPRWVIMAREVHDVPNGSVVLLEESALLYKAKKSFSEVNMLLAETIDIARHKELSLIFISQSSAIIDINIVRMADTLVIKEPSLLQVTMERRQLKHLMEEASQALAAVPDGDRKGKAYVMDVKYRGIIDTGMPTFWSEELSRVYGSYQVGAQANPAGGTVDAISYYCEGGEEFGLCPADAGSRYIHHFQKAKPKVIMGEDGKMFILGKVEVKESGINDYQGGQNDYSQLETPHEVQKLGNLVSMTVDGDELIVKDAILATDEQGERLYVVDISEVKK